MPNNYVTQMSKDNGGTFYVMDKEARTAISAETTARQQAVSAEATTRQQADSAEATARQQAVSAEATARQQADTAESTARQKADLDFRKSVSMHNSMQMENAWGYFYSRGFFNSSLVFDDSNETVITLKVPLENPEFVILSSPEDFQPTASLNTNYLYTYELADGTITRQGVTDNYCRRAQRTDSNYVGVARSQGTVKYVYIMVLASLIDDITVIMNNPLSASKRDYKEAGSIITLTAENTANEIIFMGLNYISWITKNGTDLTCLWKIVHAGDKFTNLSMIEGLSYIGSYHSADNSVNEIITSSFYTCQKDGIICLFDLKSTPKGYIYTPSKRINLKKEDIVDLDLSFDNPYDGMNAVAFGTSLTYRSQSTGGYLNFLPDISGMTFDNQGIGSSKIKGNMLAAVKAYTGWNNKNVCLLEGFVNDWGYEGNSLGSWNDKTENTVCGCVRSALNYIQQHNANMTVFLILDHYGKSYNGVDNSSTVTNEAGDTQYEFYEEIAKVAESMGIPVIKLYAISEIGENTPQYLMDNIHPTTLGAKQTAYKIWGEMRRYYPNQVSGQ